MKQISKLLTLFIATMLILVVSCKKDSDSPSNSGGSGNSDVRVTTYTPQDITANSAKCGGDAIVTQGLTLNEIGVCWNTSGNPVASDSHLSTEVWNEPFVCVVSGLLPETKYYVRAYALRGLEYYYGEEKQFTTSHSIGAINGLFSISDSKQVFFSKGNLQYQASTNTWRFAEHQYDLIGDDNANISSTYNGWIDLFGWGTGENPTNTSANMDDYLPFNDWGQNVISNGGNSTNMWRTLTIDEWGYLLYQRNTSSGIRCAMANVNGINGIIILPDNWSTDIYNLSGTNIHNSYFTSNVINLSDWTILEDAGAAFLPAAGYRHEYSISELNTMCSYWLSTYAFEDFAYCGNIVDGGYDAGSWGTITGGKSVRLVRDLE